MYEYHSNGAEIAQHFTDTVTSFEFRTTREGRALGDVRVADGIAVRSFTRQCDGQGSSWPKNSNRGPSGKWHGYAERKHRKFGWEETNFRTGDMISRESLLGHVERYGFPRVHHVRQRTATGSRFRSA